MPLSMPLDIVRRRVIKDLHKKGLVAYVWIINPETGEQTRHVVLTDRARDILNGIGRKE
jgi:hypothetical protein